MPVKENKEGERVESKSIKLDPVQVTANTDAGQITITQFEITDFDKSKYKSLENRFEEEIKPLITSLDYKEHNLRVNANDADYWYDTDKDTIIEEVAGEQTALGCGKIVIKSTFKKSAKSKEASIVISVELTKDLQKDYEIIPYSPNLEENLKWISDFMAKYVTKPFEYLDNVIGVEINFNKVFYTPEKLREVSTINADLEALENDLTNLEKDLAL
jgi:type I restriction enzyme M protein